MQHCKSLLTVFLSILLISLSPIKSLSDEKEKQIIPQYKHFSSVIFVSVGSPFATSSIDFFDAYNNIFKGTVTDFKLTPSVGLGVKLQFLKSIRIGISVEFVQAKLKDSYNEAFKTYGRDYTRYISQSIVINSFPIILTAEYIPFETQFRTYTGVGMGVVLNSMQWDEIVKSGYELDTRKGGNYIDEDKLYPAFVIYTGLELGFDKIRRANTLGCLFIEGRYTFMLRNIDISQKVKGHFEPVPNNLDRSFTIFPGYLGLNIGISLNIQWRSMESNKIN